MFCGACGTFNEGGRTTCKSCGANLMSYVAPEAMPAVAAAAKSGKTAAPVQPSAQRSAYAARTSQQAAVRQAQPVARPAAQPTPQPVQAPRPVQQPVRAATSPQARAAMTANPRAAVAARPASTGNVPDAPKSSIMPRVVLERESGVRITVTDFPAAIGKGSAASVRIEGNSAISRVHAIITFLGTFFAIEDRGSTNGTYLNGNVLAPGETVKLHTGDVLTLGNEDFKVQIY